MTCIEALKHRREKKRELVEEVPGWWKSETETISKKTIGGSGGGGCAENKADSQGQMQELRSIGAELVSRPATHGFGGVGTPSFEPVGGSSGTSVGKMDRCGDGGRATRGDETTGWF